MSNKPTRARLVIDEAKKLRRDAEKTFLLLGRCLYTVYEKELWRDMYNSYSEFLEDIDLTKGQASRLRNIYQTFVIKHGFTMSEIVPYGEKRLYAIIPSSDTKKGAERAFQAIDGLSVADVEKKMKAEKVGEHEHDWIEYRRCTICHETHRIYEGS